MWAVKLRRSESFYFFLKREVTALWEACLNGAPIAQTIHKIPVSGTVHKDYFMLQESLQKGGFRYR